MKSQILSFLDDDGISISYYKWTPDGEDVNGIIQIAHGLSENAARYERFATLLTENGYAVYANDHRGHGKTAGSVENQGYAGADGFNWMIKDMKQLNEIAKKENPGKKMFLLGHSMGSHLTQRYITIYGDSIDGVILSGTSGKQGPLLYVGVILATLGRKLKGEKTKAYSINKLSFGNFNKAFAPNKTEFDWLSRDEKEVEKYVNDEYCGAVPTFGFFYDYFNTFKILHQESTVAGIPKELPICIFSGDKDPVGQNTKSVLGLINIYKNIGIKDLTYKFYKDCRHEILNETNREEVMNDMLLWIEAHNKQ